MTEAERLLTDHWGHGYRNPPVPAVSRLGDGPQPRTPARLTGRTVGFPAPHPEPGCPSLTAEQIRESAVIQLLIANWRLTHRNMS